MIRRTEVLLSDVEMLELILNKVRQQQPNPKALSEAPIVELVLRDGSIVSGSDVQEVQVTYTEDV